MEQWLRDAIAEEQGYIICPLADGYIHCDEKCESCNLYIDFLESFKNEKEQNKNEKTNDM